MPAMNPGQLQIAACFYTDRTEVTNEAIIEAFMQGYKQAVMDITGKSYEDNQ